MACTLPCDQVVGLDCCLLDAKPAASAMTCLSAPAAGIVGFLEALGADETSDPCNPTAGFGWSDREHLPACPHTDASKSHRRGTRTASRFHRLLTNGARRVMRPLKIGVQSTAQDSSARSEDAQGSGRHVICLQDIAYQMRCACLSSHDGYGDHS